MVAMGVCDQAGGQAAQLDIFPEGVQISVRRQIDQHTVINQRLASGSDISSTFLARILAYLAFTKGGWYSLCGCRSQILNLHIFNFLQTDPAYESLTGYFDFVTE